MRPGPMPSPPASRLRATIAACTNTHPYCAPLSTDSGTRPPTHTVHYSPHTMEPDHPRDILYLVPATRTHVHTTCRAAACAPADGGERKPLQWRSLVPHRIAAHHHISMMIWPCVTSATSAYWLSLTAFAARAATRAHNDRRNSSL